MATGLHVTCYSLCVQPLFGDFQQSSRWGGRIYQVTAMTCGFLPSTFNKTAHTVRERLRSTHSSTYIVRWHCKVRLSLSRDSIIDKGHGSGVRSDRSPPHTIRSRLGRTAAFYCGFLGTFNRVVGHRCWLALHSCGTARRSTQCVTVI